VVDALFAGNAATSDTTNRRGMYFDFPNAANSVQYVLAAVNVAASDSVEAGILTTTSGTPVFVYNLQPDDNCVYPARVRFLLQQKR
jgi:hypothetical protein